MRAAARLRRYAIDDRGATAVEFALICSLFIGVVLGVIDLGRYMWELNASKSATRAGSRYAASDTLVSSSLASYDAVSAGAVLGNGIQVPEGAVPTVTCTSTACSPASGSGFSGRTAAPFNRLVAEMQKYNPRIAANNVVVEYRHVGVGFAGNPYAPDIEPLITVRLTGMTFQSSVLTLIGITSLTIPSVASTTGGEDMCNGVWPSCT